MKRRTFTGATIAIPATLLAGLPGGAARAQTRRLTSLTSRPEGGPYAIDAAMADVVKRYLPGVELSVQSTAGGNEALQLLRAGQADLAIVTIDVPARYNYTDQVRVLLPSLVAVSHLMVPKDWPHNSFSDLRGAPVSLGEPGSGISLRGRIIREALGFAEDFWADKKLSIGQAVDAFKDGNLTLVLNSNSINNAAILELVNSRRGVKFLSLPQAAVAKIVQTRPEMTAFQIPANTYQGQNYVVNTVAVPVLKVVKRDFPEDLAYRIVKTIGDHWREVAQAAPAAMSIDALATSSGPIKLHPALERYLREKGVIR